MTASSPAPRESLAEAFHAAIDGDFLVGAGLRVDNEGQDVAVGDATVKEVVSWATDALLASPAWTSREVEIERLKADVQALVRDRNYEMRRMKEQRQRANDNYDRLVEVAGERDAALAEVTRLRAEGPRVLREAAQWLYDNMPNPGPTDDNTFDGGIYSAVVELRAMAKGIERRAGTEGGRDV